MLVDIASQQQLHEVFANNHCLHKRNTTTISDTMTNGQRYIPDDLGKKADQILGRAPIVVDYSRQTSMDFGHPRLPSRVNISDQTSRVNHEQVLPIHNTNPSIKLPKDRISIFYDQLIPLISKLVAPLPYEKFRENISRAPKLLNNHVINRQEIFGDETGLNLSDDDDDDDDDDENELVNNENQNEIIPHSNSEAENDDELNATNRHPISLMDFLPGQSSPKTKDKRSLTPPITVKPIKHKEELIKSFSSSVNIPIDPKQPTLPITIPTHLFFNSNSHTDDERGKSSSKRIATDSYEPSTQPKKNKTSHVYNATNIKESTIPLTDTMLTTDNQTTITPTNVPIKKEKPTANVKPLLQSTTMENSSSPNASNASDRLTTTSASRANSANLRTMSTKELNALAREKKKQADGEKRTFEDIRQSMCLYLESVCYFIKCAHDEPIIEQRNSLQTATLNMLQHLAHNYQKMFHIPNNSRLESLNNIQQKFLIINYWLQSYIYHLQFNTNFIAIERCANQVIEYFSQSKSPVDANHNSLHEFSKHMLNSYHSNYCWNKAERLLREESSKKFFEQLLRQNSNRRLSRDHSTIDFLMYIFDAIELLRTSV